MSVDMSVAATLECQPEVIADNVPNWELAQLLHSQHVPLKEICDRCNVRYDTLQKRIAREGWVDRREKAKAIVSVTVETKQTKPEGMTSGEADNIQEQSNFARKGISSEVSELVGSLRAIKTPKSLKGIVERFNALSTVTDVCKTVYGWGQGSSTTVISISNMQAMQLAQPVAPVQPAIDVAGTVQPTLPEQVGPVTERS